MVKQKLGSLIVIVGFLSIMSACVEQSPTGHSEKKTANVHVSKQVEKSCISCHAVDQEGKLERIESVRKSPEGWAQTIARMERIHGLKITDKEREQLVVDLSKERGLAPEEAEKVQYWLANKPSYLEANPPNESVVKSCIGCHAAGRFEAQRRTEEEWKNLKDFHLVMYPSIYLNHRHTDWPEEADKAIEYLAKNYGVESKVWDQWKGNEYDVSGKWKVVGFQGTKGFYLGESEFTKSNDGYTEKKSIKFLKGQGPQELSGNMKIYTGYMLRSHYMQGKKKINGSYNVTSENLIKGDWSYKEDLGITGEETYYKVQNEKPEIFHSEPRAWKKGTTNKVNLYGMNLKKLKTEDLELPKGVEVTKLTATSDEQIEAEIKVSKNSETDTFLVNGDKVAVHGKFTLYDKADYLKIEPSYGVSRMGDAGPMDKVSIQYVAYAYSNGKDGKSETKDDLKLGPVEAEWSLLTYPEKNAKRDDRPYIGKLDKNGLYTPKEEGVNKDRTFVQENVGSATVTAKSIIDGETLTTKSHHITTVPDYVNNIH
ncbi:quinohemoprotein amine dehydrogenase subunit alpha [Bacillus aerolatus]|uniref:Quinohemoprotein amine dehydrogenase subunit alpha n=1 Tax=Bacillus aerolatus TaxID=2653354 RepID=A0A6I1FII5_9BACI|nr:quinohemoprotein amine dehydrogenase subunit alpha [Bacillus aerolatus]KAB7708241.1 quinohemoprotein amine dehydrogenase subunit alpha [Bacillus aerolatus]